MLIYPLLRILATLTVHMMSIFVKSPWRWKMTSMEGEENLLSWSLVFNSTNLSPRLFCLVFDSDLLNLSDILWNKSFIKNTLTQITNLINDHLQPLKKMSKSCLICSKVFKVLLARPWDEFVKMFYSFIRAIR